MPIRINLLADAQAAEEMRRKDPVKRAIWIGAFVVFAVLVWAGTLQLKIMAARSDITSLQVSWTSIESKVKQVREHRARTREIEGRLSALDQFTTNRTLWANAFNALQFTLVDNVRIVRLKTEQTFALAEVPRPVTPATPAATRAVVAKPVLTTERSSLTIEGRDYSLRQADQIPRYKETLLNAPYFADVLQKTNKVQLISLSAPQTEGGRTYVNFGLELFFQEKERRLYE